MITFEVHLNYILRRTETNTGISLDLRNDFLRSFHTKEDAIRFARNQHNQLKQDDIVYVSEKSNGSDKSIYYYSLKKEGYID